MMCDGNNHSDGPLFMPDGRPAPSVMTEAEAIRLLRIDVDGPKKPELTLRHYREKGKLKARRIGRHLRYTGKEIMKFLEEEP